MKHTITFKGAALALLCLILLTVSGISAEAAVLTSSKYNLSYYQEGDYYLDDRIYFYDQSGRFSEGEKEKIRSLLKETAETIGFSIALYAGGQDISDGKTEDVAFYGSRVLFSGSDVSGVVFLYIDLDGYEDAYDYMYAYHDAFLYYSDGAFADRQIEILHAMQRSFPSGGDYIYTQDIYQGLETFCSELIQYKNKGMDGSAYYQDDVNGGYVTVQNGEPVKTNQKPYRYWYIGLIVGAAFGMIIAVIISVSVKKRYKFKESASASAYTSKEKTVMRQSEDTFIGSHMTRTQIESHSGGGGGHSGGGFSGGGGTGSHR